MNRERRNSGMRKQQWSHLREGCVPMSSLTRSAPDMLYLLSPILHEGVRWNKFTFFYFTRVYLASNQTIRSLSLYFENRSDRNRDGAGGKMGWTIRGSIPGRPLGSTQSPIPWVPGTLSPGVKWLEHRAGDVSQSSTEASGSGTSLLLPLHAFVMYKGTSPAYIPHSDNTFDLPVHFRR